MRASVVVLGVVAVLAGCSRGARPDDGAAPGDGASNAGPASAPASTRAPTSEGTTPSAPAAAPTSSALDRDDLRRAFSALDVIRREGTSMSELRRSKAPADVKRCDVRRLALQKRLIRAVERARGAPEPLAGLAREAHADLHVCVACSPGAGPQGGDAACERAARTLAQAKAALAAPG